jgi:chromosome segregation ATPase
MNANTDLSVLQLPPNAAEGTFGALLTYLKSQPNKLVVGVLLWVAGLLAAAVGAGAFVGAKYSDLRSETALTRVQGELDRRNSVFAGEQASKIAQLNADWAARLARETEAIRQEANDLKVANSGLNAKVSAAETALATSAIALARRESDLTSAQSLIRTLQEASGASERKLVQASAEHQRRADELKNCAGLKKEADELTDQGRTLKIEAGKLALGNYGGVANYRAHETRVAEVTAELAIIDVRLQNVRTAQAACNR